MKTVLVALLALVPIALAPSATAASCADATEPALGTPPVYVVPAGVEAQVWTESNGFPGLQRAVCQNADGRSLPADSYWITAGPNTPIEVVRMVEDWTGCRIGVPVYCIF